MRLTDDQIKIIKQQAADRFGGSAKVWLFGSRVDDNEAGGDIDLYIETGLLVENRASAAARFAATLQRLLGDQKIDIVLTDPKTTHQPIHDAAINRGIRL